MRLRDIKKRGLKPEYYAWYNMIRRCTKPTNNSWNRYGARGITVCQRWVQSFDSFVIDMGRKPAGMSLDRVDNELGYSPENCRWATDNQQNRNKSPGARSGKLNALGAVLIRQLIKRGHSSSAVANEFGVHRDMVRKIARRITWIDAIADLHSLGAA